MAASATFVIDFGGIADAFLTAELDGDRNNSKTSFSKGDTVHFKVSADVNYTIEVSSGLVLNGLKEQEETIEAEILQFIKGEPAGVSRRLISILTNFWYGNNLGLISPKSQTQVQAANANKDTLGIAAINYITKYNQHSIVPPVDMTDIFHIIVYI